MNKKFTNGKILSNLFDGKHLCNLTLVKQQNARTSLFKTTEAYSELPQTSKMESFGTISNSQKPLIIAEKSSALNIYGVLGYASEPGD